MELKLRNRQCSIIIIAAALSAALGLAFVCPQAAWADAVSDTQKQVEETQKAYDEALTKVDDLQKQMESTQDRIDELNASIPQQRKNSSESANTLYKFNRDNLGMIETLISSQSLDDFVVTLDYIDAVNSHNIAEMDKLNSMLEELDAQEAQLQEDADQAKIQADTAQQALQEAQVARQKAQEEAVAKAKAQAEQSALLAAKEAAAKQAAANQTTADSNQSADASGSATGNNASAANPAQGVDSGNQAAEQPENDEVQPITETINTTDVSWSTDKQSFVDQWAGRIDNYLAGSALSGQGRVFAEAAWDYGVDPRWSPAISCVESSKGDICFMPCNAWGWGSYSFGSWEEAIRGHVEYLADMYGYGPTPEAASIYCPPNASFWYNRCIEEMDLI